MNTKVQNLVYTKQLLQRLNELRSKLSSRITADNVSTLSSVNVVNNEDSLTELQPTVDAVICNADMRHVLPSINFLRANKYEYKTIPINIDLTVPYLSAKLSEDQMRKHTMIKIPEGYDGLSSFVFVRVMAYAFGLNQFDEGDIDQYHAWTELDDKTLSSVNESEFIDGEYDSVFIVNKAKRSVYIDIDMTLISNFDFGVAGDRNARGRRYIDSVQGYILLWRRI